MGASARHAVPAPMRSKPVVYAIVPAYNEAPAIALVVAGLCALRNAAGRPLVERVIVADNGSTDGTGELAARAGAVVVREPRRGYGYACLAGIAAAGEADILLFVDGDHSVLPQEAHAVLAPFDGNADLVIGRRVRVAPGAMSLPQRFGNALACRICRLIWGMPMSDLGPFRAIGRGALAALCMEDKTFGWTIEMQLKAFALGQQVREVPVSLRCRIGQSKVSGTVSGVIGAGTGILSMIARLWWRERRSRVARA
jgi:glycosyltransferase involved in cell wall biosynthesis